MTEAIYLDIPGLNNSLISAEHFYRTIYRKALNKSTDYHNVTVPEKYFMKLDEIRNFNFPFLGDIYLQLFFRDERKIKFPLLNSVPAEYFKFIDTDVQSLSNYVTYPGIEASLFWNEDVKNFIKTTQNRQKQLGDYLFFASVQNINRAGWKVFFNPNNGNVLSTRLVPNKLTSIGTHNLDHNQINQILDNESFELLSSCWSTNPNRIKYRF